MGRDKALLPFHGQPLLCRVVERVCDVVDEVVVVARPGQELPRLPRGVRVAFDEVIDRGPLGGLVPGLAAISTDRAFATACDVPFLSPRVLELLFARLGAHDVAVAESDGFTHPLCAVYRATVRDALAALLAAGRLRPVFLFDQRPTLRVTEAELRAVDPELASLENLNTPDAYAAALAREES
jgi:molybdopterin-guanine dinucleotide biosynthesis protein A